MFEARDGDVGVGNEFGPQERTEQVLEFEATHGRHTVGLVERTDRPAVEGGGGGQADIGVDGDGMADDVEEGRVVIAVGVRPTARRIDVVLGTPPQHGVSFARAPDDVAIDPAGECAVGLGPPCCDDVVDAEEVGEGSNKVLRRGGGEHEGASRIAMHGELGAGEIGHVTCDLGCSWPGCGNHRIDRPADGCTGSELRRPAHDRRLTDEFEDLEGEVGQGSVDRCAEPGCGEVALKDLGRGDRNEGAVEIEERSGGGGHAQSV